MAVFCALAVLATGLRFHGLGAQGLWSDELFSVSIITQVGEGRPWYAYVPKLFPDLRIEDSALTWKAGENSPPLFEVLLWLWTGVFGLSDFSVRALSAVAGSLAPLVLFVGLRRPLGMWAAGGAALLFALSPSAVAYAQEARGYGLLMLLATCAVVRLVRYALADQARRVGGGFGFDVALYVLLSYTHYTGLVLACGLVAVRFALAWWQCRPLREFWWFAWVPLLLLPWLCLNWFSMAETGTGRFGWRDYGWSDVWALMLPKAVVYFMPGEYAGYHVLWAMLGLALVGAVWGRYTARLAGVGLDVRWVLAAAFAGMVAVHFCYGIYTAFHARVWHERYFSAMLPVGMALFALLFSLAGRHRLLPGIAVLLGCMLSLPALQAYYQAPWKEEYREASRYIAQNMHGTPTVVATWAPNAIYFNYYLRGFMAEAGRPYTLATVGAQDDVPHGVDALCQRPWMRGEQVVLFQHQMHRLYFDMLNRRCAGALRWMSGRQFRGVFVDFYEATGETPVPLP